MEVPNFNLKELIECGVHFGHKTQKWNPKMEQYIHSIRENVHIIDLTQTMGMLSTALDVIQKTVAKYIINMPKFHSSLAADQAVGTAQLKVNPKIICGHLVNLFANG